MAAGQLGRLMNTENVGIEKMKELIGESDFNLLLNLLKTVDPSKETDVIKTI
jgi:hypothetical protein